MPRRLSPLSLVGCSFLLLSATFLAAGSARAQDRKTILPSDGEEKFKKELKAAEPIFKTINKATDGEKANKDNPEHKKAIDLTAQYYTYRLTWDKLDKSSPALITDYGEVNKYMEEFFREVNSADADNMRRNNPVFTEMFLQALALRARDVMITTQPLAAVNGARMLARLAQAGSEDAGDACLEAVKNEKDFLDPLARAGVQYWALQGLGNLLGRWAEAPTGADAPAVPASRKERQAKYVEALVNVIEQFLPKDGKPPAGLTWSSRDEERGLQLFRREAVRALAQYRSPAVVDDKGKILVPSALTLLKVVNNDGLAPPVRLDEQIEAAWGVARLRDKLVPAYQPDYAAQQIAAIVVEMARTASPTPKGAIPKHPWKVYAARLADALEVMRAEAKGTPDKADEYVAQMVKLSLEVLKGGIEVNERGNAGDLKVWLSTTTTPHKTLYKGLDDSTVRPLEKSDTPEKPAEAEKKPGDKKPEEKKPGDKKPDDKNAGR
jgi:hypothetical protein